MRDVMDGVVRRPWARSQNAISEGRDLGKILRIIAPLIATEGCNLLNYSNNKDHNRGGGFTWMLI
jgi:glutamate formiminotransferase